MKTKLSTDKRIIAATTIVLYLAIIKGYFSSGFDQFGPAFILFFLTPVHFFLFLNFLIRSRKSLQELSVKTKILLVSQIPLITIVGWWLTLRYVV